MLWAKPLHFLCCFRCGSGTRLIKLCLSVKIGVAAQLCALKNLVTAILPSVLVPYSLPMPQLQEGFSQSVFFHDVFQYHSLSYHDISNTCTGKQFKIFNITKRKNIPPKLMTLFYFRSIALQRINLQI